MNKYDDTDLIELFENFETIITGDKDNIDWFITTDFRVYSEYLIQDVIEIQERLKNADDEYLFYVCEHIFNILDWITLFVVDAGLSTFAAFLEVVFEKHFDDRYILQSIYDDCFEKWISDKSGQFKIGANSYTVLDKKIYYRNRFSQWFEVGKTSAFDLKPNQEIINDDDIITWLNNDYKDTWYDIIIKKWNQKSFTGVLKNDFLSYAENETDPDTYLDFSTVHIQNLLQNPVSIKELELWYGEEIVDLEHMVKIAFFVSDLTRKRREEDSHTLYLLRDCLMFHEVHKALDILNEEETSSGQVLIGRKLLSHKPDNWGYYSVILDALFNAHLRYPDNFTDYYNEFSRLLDMFVSLNPKFATLISNLSDYVKPHIQTDENKIEIFDTGFQGSINLLTKYIIDHHIKPTGTVGKIETDIKIGVGAQWSKELFGNRYDGEYFPLLNHIQLMKRSNELYHYKDGSLNSGKLQVVMGNKEAQRKAAAELVVLVMVALVTQP